MRITLVFAPGARPSYIPLGITTLKAWIQQSVPHSVIRTVDCNLAAWRFLASDSSRYGFLLGFFNGTTGSFYDPQQYMGFLPEYARLCQAMDDFYKECAGKLEHEQQTWSDQSAELMQSMIDAVLQNDPCCIGFSVMYPDQIVVSAAMAQTLRQAGYTGMVIFGGAAMSTCDVRELMQSCTEIDGIYTGEGERGLQRIANGEPVSAIEGFWYRNGKNIQSAICTAAINLHGMPVQDYADLSVHDYFNPSLVFSTLFSRGCRWRRCRFCAHNFSFGKYRRKYCEQFVDELQYLHLHYDVSHFYFADQYIEAEDLKTISTLIMQRGLALYYHVMCRPTADYTYELLRTLYQGGCRWISWGIETGSQRLVDLCNKGVSTLEAQKVLKAAAQAGINNLAMMIFGLPTSTEHDMEQTFSFLESVNDSVAAFTSSTFQLFAKTSFAAHPQKYDLQIGGREKLFTKNGLAVHSNRLEFFHTKNSLQSGKSFNNQQISCWKKRLAWIRSPGIYDYLGCEHYLLYAVHDSFSPPTHYPLKIGNM